MSGGVDSSTVLALLMEQGHETVGLTLKILPCRLSPEGGAEAAPGSPRDQRCCTAQDIADARQTAVRLGAPHSVVEGLDVFKARVVDGFLDAYAQGLTPNPCVECNPHAKIPLLLHRALALGCERLATGHYARVEMDPSSGRFRLLKASDPAKDQSYYLSRLTQDQLSRLVFPLGGYRKEEVRAKARTYGLQEADKPESMEICFVPEGDYRDFVKAHRPGAFRGGDVVDASGRVLGRHGGVAMFTVGQRRGLDLPGGPWFVLSLDPVTATVRVGRVEDTACGMFTVGNVAWVSWPGMDGERACTVKVRYRSPDVPCTLRAVEGGRVEVRLGSPVKSVAPGQTAVFYDGDAVAGAGTILKS